MTMLTHERQRDILRRLRAGGPGSVVGLAAAVGASASTIRRDLRDLDEQGLLVRVHGGASLSDDSPEVTHLARETRNSVQKRRIAAAATQLIEDNSTVLILGGTTTEAMLPLLGEHERLTVITNGLNVALELTKMPGVAVVVLGGLLRHDEMSLLGPLAEQAIEQFHIDRAFTGAYGVSAQTGLTGASVQESSTDQRLLRGVQDLVVLADSSKFAQRGPVRMAPPERITTLITDTDAPSDQCVALREHGVRVQVV